MNLLVGMEEEYSIILLIQLIHLELQEIMVVSFFYYASKDNVCSKTLSTKKVIKTFVLIFQMLLPAALTAHRHLESRVKVTWMMYLDRSANRLLLHGLVTIQILMIVIKSK